MSLTFSASRQDDAVVANFELNCGGKIGDIAIDDGSHAKIAVRIRTDAVLVNRHLHGVRRKLTTAVRLKVSPSREHNRNDCRASCSVRTSNMYESIVWFYTDLTCDYEAVLD